ncbi:MAG: TolC family protein [Alistipes sp.]|nr:TolC family protein [Alistipes sp.]
MRAVFRTLLWGLWVCTMQLSAQPRPMELTLEQSLQLLQQANSTLHLADKQVESARSEQVQLNALWYPFLNVTGASLYMTHRIEVQEPLSQFTDPAKEFVHSILPDDQLIASILDKIGSYTLRFPLAPQYVTTLDLNLTWPIFSGGKRIYASRIGRTGVEIAQMQRQAVDAQLQVLLVESYFALRLGDRVVEVRQQTLRALEQHYRNALKLEAQGMLNRAERLMVEVSRDEAQRELESASNDLAVAHRTFRTLVHLDTVEVVPLTPLFLPDSLPAFSYFQHQLTQHNPLLQSLTLQQEVAQNALRMARSDYAPTLALMGKQTLYAHGIQKNLLPRTVVGVGLTWTLFNGLEREQALRQAHLSGQRLELTRAQAADDLGVGVDQFYNDMRNARNAVVALRTTIALSRELVRSRCKAFAEGMATSTEVVDAEVMRSKVEIASLLAYYQYDVALMRLLAACGMPELFYEYERCGAAETGTEAQTQAVSE